MNSNAYLKEALYFGFTVKSILINFSEFFDMLLIFLGILNFYLSNRLINIGIVLASYGHFPKNISKRQTPDDHTSAFESYVVFLNISGAI